MKTDNWKKVSKILVDCLEIDVSQRRNYLDKLKISSDIRAEVESYLMFEAQVEDSMKLSAAEFLKDSFDENSANLLVGQNIGVYQILGELGYGGMGAVYLAERIDGKFEQKVALKLLKREMNTAAIRRRFTQEREILAALEHPNIARLLNAGTTVDKIPYLAMEYVEGLPIDDYCNKHQLNIEQRLDLFREVCAAVDFAHRNLVVHRDLKPSNILVNNDGTPKLLDFGISKILSSELEQLNTATVTKMGVMTPNYASPEQLQNKSVTTATDIYSLGIILYELLCGHRPFEEKESDIKEIYKAVIEIDPPLPSAMAETFSKQFEQTNESPKTDWAVKNIAPLETESANARHTSPQIVTLNSSSIRGDLDNIILKALRKEPERRYSSAENLSEDIKRHLKGLPVTARPNTFSYRAEKFVNRNKASVFAGFLIFLTIIGGIGATFWQARVAQAERAKAERRFNDVRKLANSNLFDVYPEIENLEGSLKARETLLVNVLDYLDSLANEAGGDLELQSELATAYEKVGDVQGASKNQNLGNYKTGAETYLKAQSLREAVVRAAPDNLEAKESLANNYSTAAKTLWYASRTKEAVEMYEKGIKLRRELAAALPDSVEANNGLANILINAGAIPEFNNQSEEALAYFNEAFEIVGKMLEKYPVDNDLRKTLTTNHLYLSKTKVKLEKYDEALEHLNQALKNSKDLAQQFPKDFRYQKDIWQTEKRICIFYINKDDGENAVKTCAKPIEFMKISSDKEPSNATAKFDLAASYWTYAHALNKVKNYSEAIEPAEKAIELISELVRKTPDNDENYRQQALYKAEKGDALLGLGQYDKAVAELQSARDILIPVLEKDTEVISYQTDLAVIYRNLAKAHFKKGEKMKAVENVDKAIGLAKTLEKQNAISGQEKDLMENLEKEKAEYKN